MKLIKFVLPIFALLLFSQTNLDAQRRGLFGILPQKSIDVLGPIAQKQVQDRRAFVASYTGKPASLDTLFQKLFEGYKPLVETAVETASADWKSVWNVRNDKSQKKAKYAETYRVKVKLRKGYDEKLAAAFTAAINTTYIESYKTNQVTLSAAAAHAIAKAAAVKAIMEHLYRDERAYLQHIIDKG